LHDSCRLVAKRKGIDSVLSEGVTIDAVTRDVTVVEAGVTVDLGEFPPSGHAPPWSPLPVIA
jgi:hypothetical protein